MIDEPVDETYWDSVIDDPRVNDLPPNPNWQEQFDKLSGVQVVKEGNPRARQEGYPRYRDEIDYDPRTDEDWSDHDE